MLTAVVAAVVLGGIDLLIPTGDLIDHDPRYADLLGRFVRRPGAYARDGVVAIPGNHDYYTGIEAVRAAITGAGATMMTNEGLVIGDAGAGFALLGLDDLYGPRSDARSPGPDLDRAIASVPADLPRVLLRHNPQFFPRASCSDTRPSRAVIDSGRRAFMSIEASGRRGRPRVSALRPRSPGSS